MLNLPDDMTLKGLREMEEQNPQIPQYAHRHTARTYEAFLYALYRDLDSIIAALQNDRNLLGSYTENALNADIVRQLKAMGYTAHFDKNKSGHADISVEYRNFEWIGEGKKVKSVNNAHIKDGFDQLVRRYVPGTPNADRAALLIYCFALDTVHVVGAWSSKLLQLDQSAPGTAVDIVFPLAGRGFRFDCSHKHEGGGTVHIRVLGLQLYWEPES